MPGRLRGHAGRELRRAKLFAIEWAKSRRGVPRLSVTWAQGIRKQFDVPQAAAATWQPHGKHNWEAERAALLAKIWVWARRHSWFWLARRRFSSFAGRLDLLARSLRVRVAF